MRPTTTVAPVGSAKVIAIGLDSADRRLVERWCDSGDLPVLDRCVNVVHMAISPASLLWATTPLGRPSIPAFRPDGMDATSGNSWMRARTRPPVAPSKVPEEPFWAVLSRSGLRVAVLDVPKCPLTTGLNGIQIADWQVHGRDYPETCSWPPELAEALLSRFGDDHTDREGADECLCLLHSLPEGKFAAFRSHLLDGIKKKTQFASELLEQDKWDLFLVVFKEAHCVGHQCWHMTESSGQVDTTVLTDNPVKEIYRALDNAIGEIVGYAGPETAVIIFSDIGMDSNQTAEHFLDQILQRLESRLATPLQRARLAARRMKRGIRSIGRRRTINASHPRADRLAYQLDHNEISGAIRINLAGREPAGTVLPGGSTRTYASRSRKSCLLCETRGQENS